MKFFSIAFFCVLFSLLYPGMSVATKLNWIGHWKGEGKRQQLVEEVKKEYEFLYPEVQINLTYDKDLPVDGLNYKWKAAKTIAQMIQSGDIRWDVVFLGVAVYNHVADILQDPLWGKKHLVDFSRVDGFLASQEPFISQSPYYKQQTGGILAGPLIEGYIACPWYNKKTAELVGIQMQERGMTADTFLSYAKKLSQYNRAHNTSIAFLSICSFNRIESLFEYLFRSQFSNPTTPIEGPFGAEKKKAFLDTLLFFEELSKYQPIFNKGWRDRDWPEWEKQFIDGSSLFLLSGTYMYNSFEQYAPVEELNVLPVEPPAIKNASGLVGDYQTAFAVLKDAPHRAEGIKLLQLWSQPKIAEKWIDYSRNPTGIKGHLQNLNFRVTRKDPFRRFIYEMNRQYKGMPIRNFRKPSYILGKNCPVTANSFREKLSLILEGKLSAKDYFDEIVDIYEIMSALNLR